jgi:hypothetical protein
MRIVQSVGNRRIRGLVIGSVCLILLLGCNLTRVPQTRIAPTAVPTANPLESGWTLITPGIEQRDLDLELGNERQTRAVIIRIDPGVAQLRVHYNPGAPHWLNEWRDLLPEASVIVNGAFFDESDHILGLLASDGQVFGASFSGFGGMLQVTESGVRVRSLVGEPYQGEALIHAVQAFPMLIEAGGILAPEGDGFDTRSRRTAVGQDRTGRIIFVVIPYDFVSLAELQEGLLGSNLDLTIAFALDGGKSTGIVIRGADDALYPSLDSLPSVIAVYSSS